MEQIPPTEDQVLQEAAEHVQVALDRQQPHAALEALVPLHPADRALVFRMVDKDHQEALIQILDIPIQAELLEELDDEDAAELANGLATETLADVLDEMAPDEAADLLGDISPARAAKALAEMEDPEEVLPLLSHPDETAGGLMTTDYIAMRRRTSALKAIEFLRQVGGDIETPYYLNVIDRNGRLIGIVGLRDLVIADPDAVMEDIMDDQVIHVTAGIDQEDVARIMTRYNLSDIPVVDEDEKLLGIITHDDLVDVIEEEATEDIYRLANVPDRELAIDSPMRLSIRRRLPWLYLSAVTAFFAAWVIAQFEVVIAQLAILAAFQVVVAGLGGNTATQSLAITVRAIALGEIELQGSARTISKEALTGILLGTAVGVVAGISVYLWTKNAPLSLVLAVALIGNMFVAAVIGTLVPLVLKALRLDPALASSVLVTTVTDAVGFALFLGLSAYMLLYWS